MERFLSLFRVVGLDELQQGNGTHRDFVVHNNPCTGDVTATTQDPRLCMVCLFNVAAEAREEVRADGRPSKACEQRRHNENELPSMATDQLDNLSMYQNFKHDRHPMMMMMMMQYYSAYRHPSLVSHRMQCCCSREGHRR